LGYTDLSVQTAEVRAGAPDGRLVASSASGEIDVAPANTTYYLVNAATGRTLATERVTFQPSARCSAVANPKGQLTALSNPVLSCLEKPFIGTQTTLLGYMQNYSSDIQLDIHVLAPDGPLTNAIVGITVIDFSRRFSERPGEVVSIPLDAPVQTVA
jgi:hypothetical protein